MPRRYADYPDAFAGWNYISSIGSYISIIGLAVFLLNLLYAFMKKKKAEQNPWGEGATTLEWTVSSPPPFHTFEELPKVCLLYTSPSPRDGLLSRMPSSA